MKKVLSILLFFSFFFLNYAQKKDSSNVENRPLSFKYNKVYIPVGLMTSGIIFDGNGRESLKNEVVEERNEHLFGFTNHFDDYAQFAPMLAVYGFEWAGMKPRTDWQNRTAILIKGQVLNLGMVYILKTTLKKTRPDGTAFSFPSGHTANAFAGATMLAIEYGESYKWVPYVSYGAASGIGLMRMANNKHYISDVLFGAGLGILSMKAAYWTHQYKWNKPKTEKDPFAGIIYQPLN
ncbi:phosphatase PAP2 family protein [Kaistella faecalis]|uniref:phosphatase PAP2 family protein n=1 Tax=Kaistella faecalis TaxID=2852098 RepID=UPI001E53F139|nr:phosphatase PAP2 family protein [Chryseobacterium faecale]UFK98473.1 phosphatase PAP2 family protein [Chryseobacterium faecale]